MAGRRVCVSAFFRPAKREFAGIRGISKMSAKQAGKGGAPNRNGFGSRQPKEPSEIVKDIFAFAAILLIMLLSAAVTKNGIGGADVKFASAAAFVLGFVNTSAALIVGLLAEAVM